MYLFFWVVLPAMVQCIYKSQLNQSRLQELLVMDRNYIQTVETKLEIKSHFVCKFQRQLLELKPERSHIVKKEDFIHNPLMSAVRIRLLSKDWMELAYYVASYSKLSPLGLDSIRWPSVEDVEAAAKTMMRTQWTYDLDIDLLAEGILTDQKVTNMSAEDCFNMGTVYYEFKLYAEAVKWFQHAGNKMKRSLDSSGYENVLHYLIPALCFSGNFKDSKAELIHMLKNYSTPKIPHNLYGDYLKLVRFKCNKLFSIMEKDKENNLYERQEKNVLENHKRLCQGHGKQQSGLRCRYVHYQQPHLRFQPFKLEELQLEPPVFRFHDVVTDLEAEALLTDSLPYMTVGIDVDDDGNAKVSDFRKSYVAWVFPGESEVGDRLTRRISDMTRLNVAMAEPHQLSLYSIGGEYLPHHDYHKPNAVPFVFNRMATLMFYLNEVQEGGNTVFLRWGLSVPPIKNSAVLWFNLLPSGEVDPSSEHSGCPVLQGTKWVANRWFPNWGHEFNMPCGLTRDASFQPYYF